MEGAVYMGMKNDVSFVLESSLNLYEHQSTYNRNMPLRYLIYVAGHMDKLVGKKDRYAASQVKIPTPRFVVFYNGKEKQEDSEILCLSDAFVEPTDNPELELKVLMLNVNAGHNRELMEKCRPLYEYSLFVQKVRENREIKEMSIEEAVTKAVDECIAEDILKDLLVAQKSEVAAMAIFEYNEEEERAVMLEYERECARSKGLDEGRSAGRIEGRIDMLIELVQKGVLDIQAAADHAGMTREEFLQKINCK